MATMAMEVGGDTGALVVDGSGVSKAGSMRCFIRWWAMAAVKARWVAGDCFGCIKDSGAASVIEARGWRMQSSGVRIRFPLN